MKRLIRLISISLLVCLYSNINAQVRLQINVEVYQGTTKGANIHVISSVYKDYKQKVKSSGKNIVKLKFNDLYTIMIEKEGYVSKSIEVDSDLSQSAIDEGTSFGNKKITITLYPYVDELDVSIFDQPVIKFAYDRDMDDFMRDTNYEFAIAGKIEKLEAKLKMGDVTLTSIPVVSTKLAVASSVNTARLEAVSPSIVEKPEKMKMKVIKIIKPEPESRVKPEVEPQVVKKEVIKPIIKAEVIKPVVKVVPRASIVDNSDILIYPLPLKNVEIPEVERLRDLSDVQRYDLEKLFKSFINQADSAFALRQYLLSKHYFKKAATLMRLDEDAVEKYNSIDDIINEHHKNAINTKYEDLIAKADDYYHRKSLIYSRYYYNLAQRIKPNDKRVSDRLREIKITLAK